MAAGSTLRLVPFEELLPLSIECSLGARHPLADCIYLAAGLRFDAVVLTEVYAAGEAPIVGADAKALARAIRARGRIDPVLVPNAKALPGVLPDVLHDGDLVILMGAGDIGAVAQELAAKGFDGANRT